MNQEVIAGSNVTITPPTANVSYRFSLIEKSTSLDFQI